MRKLFSCVVLFALGTLGYAQGPNPSNEEAKAKIKQVVETFFDGFHKQDSTIIKSTVADEIVLQTTGRNPEGKTIFKTEEFPKFLKSIVGIPETTKFEEKLTSFSIQVDRTMANAWVGYEFWVNGEFSHCGINSFQFINFDGEYAPIPPVFLPVSPSPTRL